MSCAFSARHPTPQSATRQIKKIFDLCKRFFAAERRLNLAVGLNPRRPLFFFPVASATIEFSRRSRDVGRSSNRPVG
jgi:hypothetical protein